MRLGWDHSKSDTSCYTRAAKEGHYPIIFLGKWHSKALSCNKASTWEEQNQTGSRECAYRAVSCSLTKSGKQVSRETIIAPKANPSVKHMMLQFDPRKQLPKYSSKKEGERVQPMLAKEIKAARVSLWGRSSWSHAMFALLVITFCNPATTPPGIKWRTDHGSRQSTALTAFIGKRCSV